MQEKRTGFGRRLYYISYAVLYEAPPDIIYSLSLCSSFISIQATLPLTFIFTVLKSRALSSVCRFRYEMSACLTWVEKVGTRRYKNIFGLMLLLTLILLPVQIFAGQNRYHAGAVGIDFTIIFDVVLPAPVNLIAITVESMALLPR